MKPLSEPDILKIWEWGQSRHPVERILGPLALTLPDQTWEELYGLSIGQRDQYLLALYEVTFSPNLDCMSDCPGCGESLEFNLRIGEIKTAETMKVTDGLEIEEGSYTVKFRLPDSNDLNAISNCNDEEDARRLLIRRCVLKAQKNGKSMSSTRLPIKVIKSIADRMAECDPQADILLDLKCPACRHNWQLLLDIAIYLWNEIKGYAVRLLEEVHILAANYGWGEEQILDMNPGRRRHYLRMLSI